MEVQDPIRDTVVAMLDAMMGRGLITPDDQVSMSLPPWLMLTSTDLPVRFAVPSWERWPPEGE